MHRRETATNRRKTSSSNRLRPASSNRRASVEQLEVRRLLSVSSEALVGPIDVVGTHWEYAAVDGQGNTSTYIETAGGPTTFNGNDCVQLNIGPTGASHAYVGFDDAGNYLDYGGFIQYPSGTAQTDTFTPAPSLPAQLEAGTTYSATYTDDELTVDSSGSTTDTVTDTDTTLLVSDSTSPITVPAGTYDAYEIRTGETTVTSDGNGSPSSSTTTTDEWVVPGVGYVKATEYGDDGSVDATFNLSVFKSADSKLAFVQQPTNTAPGDTVKPPVKVAVEDADGNVKTASTDSITLSLGGAGTGTLSGTVTEPALNGVATFSDLSIDDPGKYTLTATDHADEPATPATSAGFTITAGKLVYLKSPTNGSVNEKLTPTITVALENSHNKIITDSDGTLVTLTPMGSAGEVSVTGNTAVLSGGKATFSGLTFKQVGTFMLQTDDGGDTDATSKPFTIAPDKLKITRRPANTDINTEFAVSVELTDNHGKPITDATTSVALTLNIITGHDTAELQGTTLVALTSGVATFTPDAGPKVDASGTFTITATEDDDSTGTPIATTTSTPTTSYKFKVTGPTLKSITGTEGTEKDESDDDGLTFFDGTTVAVLESNDSMSFVANGLKPNTPAVLAGIGWTAIRNPADMVTGATPVISVVGGDPLQASLPLNAIGSFNVICYYDSNSNGAYDAGEELNVFHLAMVGTTIKPGGTEAASSAYFGVTNNFGQPNFITGDFKSKYAMTQSETEQLIGGGADGMLGVSQIHTGFVQDGTTDTAAYHNANGTTTVERLKKGSFPIVDSSNDEDAKHSEAIFGVPLDGGTPGKYGGDKIIGADPAGGQDRAVSTGDSPQLDSDSGSVIAADGTLGFESYLAAFSSAYRMTYVGYVKVEWSATFQFVGKDGAWDSTGSHVDATSSILDSPVTLDSVGFVTTGPVYTHSIKFVVLGTSSSGSN